MISFAIRAHLFKRDIAIPPPFRIKILIKKLARSLNANEIMDAAQVRTVTYGELQTKSSPSDDDQWNSKFISLN